jgi:NAD(P)H-hydrate epimerase
MERKVDWPSELLTTMEMSAVDAAATAAGVSVDRLMLRAGEAVARRAAAVAEGARRILVLCGPGNNGGDGYVAARVLADRGLDVSVFAVRPPQSGGAAGRAADGWLRSGVSRVVSPFDAFQPEPADVVIDALYGAGLSRAIEGDEAAAVERLNDSGATVVAVDVPSGLAGDSGWPTGPCVAARDTVTFHRLKPGHLLWPGRGLCGALTCADIGITDANAPAAAELHVNRPELWRRAVPRPSPDTHKYRRGHCLVVSGSEFRTGASRLAAIAALNAGSGAVTIAGEEAALRVHAAHLTAIMLQPAASQDEFREWIAARRPTAAVIGPAAGVGEGTLAQIRALLDAAIPAVLDADALTSLVERRALLQHRADPEQPIVLTPHVGEFVRLFHDLDRDAVFGGLPDELRRSKVEQARAAARLSGAVVVYKGVDTVISDPRGRAAINVNAGPELASAGTGDVLAGLIGAHLAQGMPAFQAAAAAVWLHGDTGRAIGVGLTADRLARRIRPLARLLGAGAEGRNIQ